MKLIVLSIFILTLTSFIEGGVTSFVLAESSGANLQERSFGARSAKPNTRPANRRLQSETGGMDLPLFYFSFREGEPGTIRVGDFLKLRVLSDPQEEISERQIHIQPAADENALRQSGWTYYAEEFPDLTLVPLLGGEVSTPELLIIEEGKPIGRIEPQKLQVESLMIPEERGTNLLSTVRPPERLEFPIWLVIGGAGILLVLISLLIFFMIRYARKVRSAEPPSLPKEKKPAHALALSALLALQEKGLLEKERFKEYYFSLSEIIKKYFEMRFGFDAVESTTDEMLEGVKPFISDTQWKTVQNLFTALDRVKFTDHIPEVREGGELMEVCKEIIEETKLSGGMGGRHAL